MHSFDKSFRDLLLKRVADLYDKKRDDLAAGRATGGVTDASAMGIKAAEAVAYLRALSDVERLCKQIEDELNRS